MGLRDGFPARLQDLSDHCLTSYFKDATMPPPESEVLRGQEEVAAVVGQGIINENYVGKPSHPMDTEDLEAALNYERSRQASFRSFQSSRSSFCSFKSIGKFSTWGSFKSFKSGVSLTSFLSAKWDVNDAPGGREVAMVAPLPRAPKVEAKLEMKKKNNDFTFLLIFSTGILLALLSAAFAIGLW